MTWSNIAYKILSVGTPVHEYGMNNWALSIDQAIGAIELFKKNSIPILGGDVIYFNNGKPMHTYDNWSCKEIEGESSSNYIDRCARESCEYIRWYSSISEGEMFFLLVPKSRSTETIDDVDDPTLFSLRKIWLKENK